ncbi:MAG: tyrosine-type recombinase/integrase [Acidimicrobiales bacterium]
MLRARMTGEGGSAHGSPSKPTPEEVAALLHAYLLLQENGNTRAAYGADLRAFLTWCTGNGVAPGAVGPAELERFRADSVSAGASSATVARRMSALRSFYAFAVTRGVIAIAPLPLPRPTPIAPSTTPTLTESEVSAVLDAAGTIGGKSEVLITLLLLDGVRLGEVLVANAQHLTRHPPPPYLLVRRSGGPTQLVLDGRSQAALDRALVGRTEGPLLLGNGPVARPGRLTRFGADYLIKQVGRAAELATPLSANTLRRTHVVLAYQSDPDLNALRDRLGHRDARTTKRHLDP